MPARPPTAAPLSSLSAAPWCALVAALQLAACDGSVAGLAPLTDLGGGSADDLSADHGADLLADLRAGGEDRGDLTVLDSAIPDLADAATADLPDAAVALPDLTDAGAPPDLTDGRVADGAMPDLVPPPQAVNVLEFHNSATRAGLYVDGALTVAAVRKLARDGSFDGTFDGNVYAQPLYLEGGPGGRAVVIVATEGNDVIALDAKNGKPVWKKNLGQPATGLWPCGNIDPLGVTGTPVIDASSRTLYVAAMTSPQGGHSRTHLIFALNADDGTVLPGYPVDVAATAAYNNLNFVSEAQNQRGALAFVDGRLYVPYGGHFGDCGAYHGWLVGVKTGQQPAVTAWATRGDRGGSWAVSGAASDGTSIFIATGNTSNPPNWSDGEGVFKFKAGPVDPMMASNYWAPSNWRDLDNGDIDLGGSGAVLVDVPGATPSRLVVAMGKDGFVYLLDRDNLGGIGGEVAKLQVSSGEIIQAGATYATAKGTYLAFHGPVMGCPGGGGGDLGALRISAARPPAITVAWCASQNGQGSPFVTSSDGSHDALVWGIGAEDSQRLRAFDGDTGDTVFDGGGPNELMVGTRRFESGIAARGRVFVAADKRVYAFKP